MLRKLLFTAVIATATLLFAAPQADAAFRLRVEHVESGTGIVITDEGLGDGFPGAGTLLFAGSIGPLTVNVTTGISKPTIGGVNNFAEMDLSSVNVSVSGPATVRITLEDTGFTGGPDGAGLGFLATIGGTLTAGVGSTITGNAWVNPLDAVIALGPDAFPVGLLGAIGPIPPGSVAAFTPAFTAGPGAFAGTGSTTFTKAGAYSMFTQVTTVFAGSTGGTVSFDMNLQTLPAPAGLVLVFCAAPALGLVFLRRRKVQPAKA